MSKRVLPHQSPFWVIGDQSKGSEFYHIDPVINRLLMI
jgi:hypothetical protein